MNLIKNHRLYYDSDNDKIYALYYHTYDGKERVFIAYNEDGYFDINERGVYSLNSKTVKRDADGSVAIQFGECKGVDNCLAIMDGWNYAIRMYKPKESILDSSWTFPKPTPK